MLQQTLDLLDFEGLLGWLKEETHSEAGAEAALKIRPELSPEQILSSWQIIQEARSVLCLHEGPNLRDHIDLAPILSRLAPEGARLSPFELREIYWEAKSSTETLAYFSQFSQDRPLLSDLFSSLFDFSELIAILERSLGPDGEILDSASPNLARLRLELSGTKSALTLKLSELMRSEVFKPILMDELVTTRNERFVVPVRASAAGRSRGLVHDWSKSGATAYLEPLETVEDNNRLAFIKSEEKREIERILIRLSDKCRELSGLLETSGAALTKIDLIMAEARLAMHWRAWSPDYAPGEGLKLIGARHPLLERRLKQNGRSLKPLDLTLLPQEPIMVVSGVNAGGKTVALKTLGLLTLLALAGLPLPASEGSRIDFPSEIVCLMGDGQDITSDLSTFSGHIKGLNFILETAKPGVLVIVDELGAGTDPAEGAALGLAVLERLRQSGALVCAATHFHLIKSWATLTEGVASAAVNSSPSGHPVYGLSYGAPGFSGGLAIARRLGLPLDLVDRAESFLDDGQRKASELLKKLDEERGFLARKIVEVEQREKELEKFRKESGEEFNRRKINQNKRLELMEAEIKAALNRYRQEFQALKQEARQLLDNGEKPDLRSMSLKMAQLDKKLNEARPPRPQQGQGERLTNVSEGDVVMVNLLGLIGVVKSCQREKNEYVVEAGAMTVKASLGDLSAPPAQTESLKGAPAVRVSLAPREPFLSLNLIGQTVAEAEEVLAKEIERALIDGRKAITIIHGQGTGRLRRAVQELLSRHPQVKDFFSPANLQGGAGVTQVEFYE
ncbi:MAG: Smr/MutS family protein [Deltaproteobacteria bacterium]|jgi:DNA mismatch repair protein MutS2|nr:Smr/MutS family protein [Deltaproteobacteria bacterium]